MGSGTKATASRKFMLGFNNLFLLLGGGCVALAIWVLLDKQWLNSLTKIGGLGDSNVLSLLEKSAFALAAGGAVVFLIAFLGFCGVLSDNKLAVFFYALVLSLTLICEVVAGVVAILYKEQMEFELKGFLNDTIYEKYDGDVYTAEPYSVAWNFAHVTFDCCGVENYTDFYIAQNWNRSYSYTSRWGPATVIATIPTMCCQIVDDSVYPLYPQNVELKNVTCPLYPSTDNSWYSTGCYEAVKQWMLGHALWLLAGAMGVAAIEVIGIVAACCVFRDIKNKNNSKVDQE